jgi:hypothetical protein
MKSIGHVESTHMRVNFKPGLSNKSSQKVSKLIRWSDLITMSNSFFLKSIFHFAFPIELEEVLINKKKESTSTDMPFFACYFFIYQFYHLTFS